MDNFMVVIYPISNSQILLPMIYEEEPSNLRLKMSQNNFITNIKIQNPTTIEALMSENRSFKYGDGLFETMIFKNGKVQYVEDHFERLFSGMKLLKMNINSLVSKTEIISQIHAKLALLSLSEARIRLTVWRQNGGLYTPKNSDVNYFIEINSLPNYFFAKNLTQISSSYAESITLNHSAISHLKTNNSLPYILASIEKKEKNVDEIIILTNNHEIAECSSSNLFIVKDEVLFTPSLFSGCIDGVMRKNILRKSHNEGFDCKEIWLSKKDLLTADYIFTTNVMGIKFITQIDNYRNEKFMGKITDSRYFSSILSSF
jgi:4-amino-4-deoxychorismate lyase